MKRKCSAFPCYWSSKFDVKNSALTAFSNRAWLNDDLCCYLLLLIAHACAPTISPTILKNLLLVAAEVWKESVVLFVVIFRRNLVSKLLCLDGVFKSCMTQWRPFLFSLSLSFSCLRTYNFPNYYEKNLLLGMKRKCRAFCCYLSSKFGVKKLCLDGVFICCMT